MQAIFNLYIGLISDIYDSTRARFPVCRRFFILFRFKIIMTILVDIKIHSRFPFTFLKIPFEELIFQYVSMVDSLHRELKSIDTININNNISISIVHKEDENYPDIKNIASFSLTSYSVYENSRSANFTLKYDIIYGAHNKILGYCIYAINCNIGDMISSFDLINTKDPLCLNLKNIMEIQLRNDIANSVIEIINMHIESLLATYEED